MLNPDFVYGADDEPIPTSQDSSGDSTESSESWWERFIDWRGSLE